MAAFSQRRRQLVERQIKSRGVLDPGVLAAVESVPREAFLPPEMAEFAYLDRALPIEKGQTISQPYVVALMTEALQLKPRDRVLEVGTGSGYPSTAASDALESMALAMNPKDANFQAILSSPSLVLAERDIELLARPELRPVRLQLELLKPELALAEQRIRSTVVVFGSTEIVEKKAAELRLREAQAASALAPHDAGLVRDVGRCERLLAKSHLYDEAREFGRLISSQMQTDEERHYVVVTGGGPGIMEAVNRGAFDVGAKSVGLNILLPSEQQPNPYITPELCFQFHYFALRKLHFLLRAKALVAFPGGFGTMDELFDALTLRQTQRMQAIPIIMYSRAYWERVLDLHFLADEGVIDDEDLSLVQYAENPEQIVDIISRFYSQDPSFHEGRR